MIIVRVELWSAKTGGVTELARMKIAHAGGTDDVCDYSCCTYYGRGEKTLTRAMTQKRFSKTGKVEKHRRKQLHVWNLVAKALLSMGYGNHLPMKPKQLPSKH